MSSCTSSCTSRFPRMLKTLPTITSIEVSGQRKTLFIVDLKQCVEIVGFCQQLKLSCMKISYKRRKLYSWNLSRVLSESATKTIQLWFLGNTCEVLDFFLLVTVLHLCPIYFYWMELTCTVYIHKQKKKSGPVRIKQEACTGTNCGVRTKTNFLKVYSGNIGFGVTKKLKSNNGLVLKMYYKT